MFKDPWRRAGFRGTRPRSRGVKEIKVVDGNKHIVYRLSLEKDPLNNRRDIENRVRNEKKNIENLTPVVLFVCIFP